MRAGFFSMENSAEVLKYTNVDEAKAYANSVVDSYLSKNRPLASNVVKVRKDIAAANSVKNLSFIIANYVLAHPSEGLKVLR